VNSNKLEILGKTEVLRRGFFRWDLVRFRFVRFDGTESAVVENIVFERGDSVAMLVHDTSSQEIVLVEQLRISTETATGGWILEIPAGRIDSGEEPMTAAIRELSEETGASTVEPQFISAFYPSPGACSERIHLFYCPFSKGISVGKYGGLAAENEDLKIHRVTLKQAFEWLEAGQLVDAKTMIAVMWLKAQIEKREGYGTR
jgi:ADP-ribose pyrophosphatase